MSRMFSVSIRVALILAVPALTGCESVGVGGVFGGGHRGGGVGVGVNTSTRRPPPPPPPVINTAHLGIPPGHLPPPGYCRVWYPDRAPGRQPKHGRYEDLHYNVPPGAWLIVRPYDHPEHIIIHDYTGVPSHVHRKYRDDDDDQGRGRGGKYRAKGPKKKKKKKHEDKHIYTRDSHTVHPVPYPDDPSIQVGVRVYDSNSGVYVGVNIPIN